MFHLCEKLRLYKKVSILLDTFNDYDKSFIDYETTMGIAMVSSRFPGRFPVKNDTGVISMVPAAVIGAVMYITNSYIQNASNRARIDFYYKGDILIP